MLVDDDALSAALMRGLLEKAGFTGPLQVIPRAETALAFFGALSGTDERPQLVLVDLGFPGGHGFEIVRAIRRNPACATAYIAVLTGSSHADDKAGAFSVGADAFLEKFPSVANLVRLREAVAARE